MRASRKALWAISSLSLLGVVLLPASSANAGVVARPDFNRDGIADVFAISMQDPGSGMTAVHVLDGASRYSRFSGNFASALHQTNHDGWAFSAGDKNRDGRADIYAISMKDVGSQRTAVHVLDGASRYSRFSGNFATALHQTDREGWTFAAADWNRDGIADLLAISMKDEGSHMTAVHVLDGASGFTRFVGHFVTPLHMTDRSSWAFTAGDFDRDGVADIYAVSMQDTGTGRTAVHVLDGASRYSRFAGNFQTPLHSTDPTSWAFTGGDTNRDGVADLIAVSMNDPGSGGTAVHVLDGRAGFSRFIGNFPTALHKTDPSSWAFS